MTVNRCIHGLEKEYCSYCNGLSDKKLLNSRIKDHELEILKDKYDILKAYFKSFNDIWTEEEIYAVYKQLKDVTIKDRLKACYKLSIELGRTKNAIKWMYSHIFSDKIDLHRGQAVIKFRQELKIQ